MSKEVNTSCKKQLIRNAVVENNRGIVIKNTKPIVPPIDLCDMDFEESSQASQLKEGVKKTTFKIPDINQSFKNLTLSPSSKHSKTNIHAVESKKSFQSTESSKLSVPTLHSSLNISKKVDRLGKMKTKYKSAAEIRTAAYEEILSRQVNFPYQKKIYRDLIPLSSPNEHRHTVITTRDPMPPKDREPTLENFIAIKPVQEFSYIPNIKLDDTRSKTHCNSLLIYKLLKMLEQ